MAGNGNGNAGDGEEERTKEEGKRARANKQRRERNGRCCGLTSLWIAAALLLTSVSCPAACRAWTGRSGAARHGSRGRGGDGGHGQGGEIFNQAWKGMSGEVDEWSSMVSFSV